MGGIDPLIMGSVQTANPDFQAGESVTDFAGLNFVVTERDLRGSRHGIERGILIVQDLNGPQMLTDFTLTVEGPQELLVSFALGL
jgi:hypothetical protein